MADYPEKELILQDLMDVEYIALETTDDFITKGAVKAIGKDIMLVTNRGSDGEILVFDKNGKGLRKINRLGQSGEEYTQLTGLVLDEDNDEIFVKDNPARKIGVYDLLGNYKRSFKFTDTSYYNYIFNYDRDHLICYKSYPSEKGKRECHLIISKQDGRITHEIQIPSKGIETPVVTEGEFVITPEFYLTFPDRDKWILVNTSSDTIFHYLPDGNLSPFIVRSPSISSMDTKVFLFPTVITDRAPDDIDAQKLVRDCEEYLEEENSLELDWNEREKIIRQETIPPADDDILGHVKVHIDQQFGVYTQLLTDDSDPDHPLEIAIIPPRPEHDYYTLVTVGLSRHRMGFPEERWEEKLERAELLINLPRDWKLTKADCREERWSWPIRMMLATAHFAMEDPEVGLESRTTLDEGEDGIPFAENTELRGEILLCPGVFGTDSFFCRLPDGDEVNFYQVIPLYREEIQYKLEHGSDALLDLCPDESLEVINPHRLNVVTDGEKISYDPAEMDNAAEQIKKIRALHLPVDELDAYNRMAFFLGWAMKRGQMSNPFLSRHREVVEAVWAGKGPDLRAFILNKLDGKLSTQFFDRRGSGFAQWYAQDNRSNPYIYRRDCRNIVLAESKDRVWNSIAEKDAAYLLLPYTEKSRQRVEQLLDERYQQYLEAEFADDPEKRVARAAEGKPAVIPDWDGPLFCYASDRVAQDGCKVQIMDRLFPEREDMGWESGWAFYSGDEGDVYGEGDEYYESHCGFYDIRDICRIDPDIIPLLNLPYGTMQMRGEDGAWYEVIRDDEGEEET